VVLTNTVKALLSALLRVKQVRDLRGAAVVDVFKPFKELPGEILESLQAAHDQASQDLYILYFHPVGGELLYKQMREIKGMENLGVGIDMLPSKTTSETLAAAAKAVEQVKKEKEKAKKDKEKRDTKLLAVGVSHPGGKLEVEVADVVVGCGVPTRVVMVGTLSATITLTLTGGGMAVVIKVITPILKDHRLYYNGGYFNHQAGRGGGPRAGP
jgi:hypothetical protein